MKKIYTLFISFLFLTSLANAQNAQCNGGGCYNLNLQNPSGTFNTSSNGWSLVANCMTGGNYAVFDVACGGVYEWTTCSDFGGMQAWDAEITLLDATNNILCFQDNSGRPGCSSSPYLGWTATFTGQVKILLTEAGCITNASGCNRLEWRMAQGLSPGHGFSILGCVFDQIVEKTLVFIRFLKKPVKTFSRFFQKRMKTNGFSTI